MKLIQKETATIYSFETQDGFNTVYRIECIDGIVSGIQKYTVEYCDCGDAENGPKVGSELSEPMSMEMSRVWFERDLEDDIGSIVKDTEAYTLYCMQSQADYSAACYGDSQ